MQEDFIISGFPIGSAMRNLQLIVSVINSLTNMGHILKERQSLGSINAIMILPDGKKAAGADKRGNNSSCGY